VICNFCSIPGHTEEECRKKKASMSNRVQKAGPSGLKSDGFKYANSEKHKDGNGKKLFNKYSTMLNHIVATTSLIEQPAFIERTIHDIEFGAGNGKFNKSQFNFDDAADEFTPNDKLPPLRTVKTSIEGISSSALLDTGSQRSHISKSFLDHIIGSTGDFAPVMSKKLIEVKYANGAIEIGGAIVLHAKINGINLDHEFIVLQKPTYDVIIGLDVMDKLSITISAILQ
jgi:hypothetical protein